ncbi:hypothetical protein BDZ91DRAFT_722021 [Kalaharituber pfeilii]|nr:hypothetical protein BDZ91DRAFT_722021 [Kalaharituber pfeilii]
MDAWTSPWAESPDQGEQSSHGNGGFLTISSGDTSNDSLRVTETHLSNNSLQSSAFQATNTLVETPHLSGAEIWASDAASPVELHPPSPWNVNSTTDAFTEHHHNEDFPNWDSKSPGLHPTTNIESSSTTTEIWNSQNQVSGLDVASGVGNTEDWAHQPDGESTTPSLFAAGADRKDVHHDSRKDSEVEITEVTEEIKSADSTIPELPNPIPDEKPNPTKTVATEIVTSRPGDNQTVTKVVDDSHKDNISAEMVEAGSPEGGEGDDDFGDFGDFEEFDDFTEAGLPSDSGFGPVPAHKAIDMPPVASVKSILSPLDFPIDRSFVSKLYPLTPEIPPLPPITEIISTISARKAWYRISREGTLGKHKSGNSDDYVRVTWAKSRTKQEVTEIVSRWMKEGRFSVPGAITGDQGYGAMFGWGDGSNAPSRESTQKLNRNSVPVGLALRGARENTKSKHKPSISISSWDPLADKTLHDSAPVVDFGWGSSGASKKTQPIHPATSQEIPSNVSAIGNSPKSEKAIGKQGLVATPGRPTSMEATNSRFVSSQDVDSRQQSKLAVQATEDWRGFETPTVNTISASAKPVNSSALPQTVSPEDNWGSLAIFEQAGSPGVSHSNVTVFETELPNLESAREEVSKEEKLKPEALQIISRSNDDDDWGEMMDSAPTPNQPHPQQASIAANVMTPHQVTRRPSTAHGDSLPFGISRSAPFQGIVSSSTRSDPGHPLMALLGATTDKHLTQRPAEKSMEISIPSAVDSSAWDFSVFERPSALQPIEEKESDFGVFRKAISGPKPHSKEDQLVRDIVDGLPDMSFMLR